MRVKVDGITFEIDGRYIPAYNGYPDSPDEPEYIEDFDILVDGISIHDMLTERAIDRIYDEAMKEIKDYDDF